jgi:ribosomal protein L11 methylase PrmA
METVRKVRRSGLLAIIESLSSTIKKLKWKPQGTEWSDYYESTNYSSEAFQEKKRFLSEFLEEAKPADLWDIGANMGVFSRIAGDRGIRTICFDIDPSAVEKNYLKCVEDKEKNILPLVLDLTNPSPAIGWENLERMSFLDRAPADVVLAMALIHHLAISNNVPLGMIADFFAKIANWLIIEFVPKADSQVQRLLWTREDIFSGYTQGNFEAEFKRRFQLHQSRRIADSDRTLYLMKRL